MDTKVLSITIPEGLPQALKMSDEEFLKEARALLAAKLYELGKVSLGVAAEIAGTERLTFLALLDRYGVPAFRDEVREYLEIAVLTVVLRAGAKMTRLTELIHRAIPYPVVLVILDGGAISISLAHKRWSQGETGKVVIEMFGRQLHCGWMPSQRGELRSSRASLYPDCRGVTCSRFMRAGLTA